MGALVVALAALGLHLYPLRNYGYLADELYFIACSRHLAWGYVDQPPLVAVAAWMSAPTGYNLIALRIFPALMAALAVWVASRIARELGGGRFAQTLAALATMMVPAYLLLGNMLVTTSFEPLSWSLLIYFVIRLVRSDDPRYWLAIAAAFTFGMYSKYSMLLLAAAVGVGLLLTPQRRVFASRWFAIAVALSFIAILPNAAWQWSHGWPFLGVLHGDYTHRHPFQTGLMLEYKNMLANTVAFVAEQFLYTNPFIAIVWLIGLGALMLRSSLRDMRWLPIAYVLLIVVAILTEAKGYYIVAIYASLVAVGSVVVERWLRARAMQTATVVALLACTIPAAPLSIPILPIKTFIAYSQLLHLTGQNGTQPKLVQPLYAEEFGWDEFTKRVADVYHSLPPAQRARTGIFADTYGDAGALALFGPRYGLPAIIGSQNNFYLWGPHGYDGRSLLVIGATEQDTVRKYFRKMTLLTTIDNPYKWVVQGPDPVYLCTDPVAPLPQIWPKLGWYGA